MEITLDDIAEVYRKLYKDSQISLDEDIRYFMNRKGNQPYVLWIRLKIRTEENDIAYPVSTLGKVIKECNSYIIIFDELGKDLPFKIQESVKDKLLTELKNCEAYLEARENNRIKNIMDILDDYLNEGKDSWGMVDSYEGDN